MDRYRCHGHLVAAFRLSCGSGSETMAFIICHLLAVGSCFSTIAGWSNIPAATRRHPAIMQATYKLLPVQGSNTSQQSMHKKSLITVRSSSYVSYPADVVGQEAWESKDARIPRGWPKGTANVIL